MLIYIQNALLFIFYFILYSFLGWVLESVYKSILQKKLVNSGFLQGPFCPIYGLGAIAMIIFLGNLKGNIIITFILAFFILTLWEYIVAIYLEKVFKTKYWDYSKLKYNIQGRICLKNSIYWGILGVIFIEWIHPVVEAGIKFVPKEMLFYITIILSITILIDTIVSIIRLTQMEKKLKRITEIGENIKQKLEELKVSMKDQAEKNVNLEHLQEMIKILKIEQTKMKIKIYRQARRLKKAFPTIQSDSISEILSQTIDIKGLKNKIRNKEKQK